MEECIIKQAIHSMVNDIKLTMGFDDSTILTHKITMSIVCNNKQSLLNAVQVFKQLDIRANYILFIPMTIRMFNLDTIDAADVFGCLKSSNPNITSIVIHDSNKMNSGDFHIDLFIENIESGTNEYVGYQSLFRYCNDLQKL